MPCYHPLTAVFLLREDGKKKAVFKKSVIESMPESDRVQLPCGKCIGCRLDYSRKWAVRCVNESMMHDENCFITLTYSDENYPGHLVKSDLQKWQKRLRKAVDRDIRFFSCGEYGTQTNRAHYHALVFGWRPHDREFLYLSDGIPLFRSLFLEKTWPFGIVSVGDVTFETAAYVARYNLKKQVRCSYGKFLYPSFPTDFNMDSNYVQYQTDYQMDQTEIEEEYPPFLLMSRRPGIGRPFYDSYHTEIHANDFVFSRGKKVKVPRYYDNVLQSNNVGMYEAIKLKRKLKAECQSADNTADRLRVREECHHLKSQRLVRD